MPSIFDFLNRRNPQGMYYQNADVARLLGLPLDQVTEQVNQAQQINLQSVLDQLARGGAVNPLSNADLAARLLPSGVSGRPAGGIRRGESKGPLPSGEDVFIQGGVRSGTRQLPDYTRLLRRDNQLLGGTAPSDDPPLDEGFDTQINDDRPGGRTGDSAGTSTSTPGGSDRRTGGAAPGGGFDLGSLLDALRGLGGGAGNQYDLSAMPGLLNLLSGNFAGMFPGVLNPQPDVTGGLAQLYGGGRGSRPALEDLIYQIGQGTGGGYDVGGIFPGLMDNLNYLSQAGLPGQQQLEGEMRRLGAGGEGQNQLVGGLLNQILTRGLPGQGQVTQEQAQLGQWGTGATQLTGDLLNQILTRGLPGQGDIEGLTGTQARLGPYLQARATDQLLGGAPLGNEMAAAARGLFGPAPSTFASPVTSGTINQPEFFQQLLGRAFGAGQGLQTPFAQPSFAPAPGEVGQSPYFNQVAQRALQAGQGLQTTQVQAPQLPGAGAAQQPGFFQDIITRALNAGQGIGSQQIQPGTLPTPPQATLTGPQNVTAPRLAPPPQIQQPDFFRDILSRSFGVGQGLQAPEVPTPPGIGRPQTLSNLEQRASTFGGNIQAPQIQAPGFQGPTTVEGPGIQGTAEEAIRQSLLGGGLTPEFIGAMNRQVFQPQREELLGRLNQQGGGVARLDSPLFQELMRRQERDFSDSLIRAGFGNYQQAIGQGVGLGAQQFGQGVQNVQTGQQAAQFGAGQGLQAALANAQAAQEAQRLGVSAGAQGLGFLSDVSNQEVQRELANQQARQQAVLANLGARQETQALGVNAGLQGLGLTPNLLAQEIGRQQANQGAGQRFGEFGAGQNLQAQQLNQAAGQRFGETDLQRQLANIANLTGSGQFNLGQSLEAERANQAANLQAQGLGVNAGLQGLGFLPGLAAGDVSRQLANISNTLQQGQFGAGQQLQAALANAQAAQGTQQFGAQLGLEGLNLFPNLLAQEQARGFGNVQNLQNAGQFNAGQAQQIALANQAAQQATQGLGVNAGLQGLGLIPGLAGQDISRQGQNVGNALQAALANQGAGQRSQEFNLSNALARLQAGGGMANLLQNADITRAQALANIGQQGFGNALAAFQAVPQNVFPFLNLAGDTGQNLLAQSLARFQAVPQATAPFFGMAQGGAENQLAQSLARYDTLANRGLQNLTTIGQLGTLPFQIQAQNTGAQQNLLNTLLGGAQNFLGQQGQLGLGLADLPTSLARSFLSGEQQKAIAEIARQGNLDAARAGAIGNAIGRLVPSINWNIGGGGRVGTPPYTPGSFGATYGFDPWDPRTPEYYPQPHPRRY